MGNVKKKQDTFGTVNIFTYDNQGRQTSKIEQNVNGTQSIKTSSRYDKNGNKRFGTDANGVTTEYTYDELNRLICVTDPLNEKTTYTYDLNGSMLTQTDGNGHAVTFEYNAVNKLLRKIDHGGRNGASGNYSYIGIKTESYTYYPDGNMKTFKDRNGVTTTYTYDIHGRKVSEEAGTEKISYTYDNNGNTLTMTDSTGTTTRAYDELNRVITKSVPKFGTSTFMYDIMLPNEEFPDEESGYAAEKTTDAKRNETIKIYDREGRLKKVSSDNGSAYTAYEYDNNGNVSSIQYPNGSEETYTYYDNNLLKTLTNKKPDKNVIDINEEGFSYSYTYDSANNQVSKTDSKGTTNYAYDSLNRLKKVTEPSGGKVTEYTFDRAGNRETETITADGTTSVTIYAYNEQNRLITTETQTGDQKTITRYSYDGNGNLTYKTGEITKKIDPQDPLPTPHFGMIIPGQKEGGYTKTAKDLQNLMCSYTYDVFNNLIKADGSGQSESYAYNGEGLRVEKDMNGDIVRYLYEYDRAVLETDGKGNQTARNVYGTNLISRTVSSETAYYFYNGHGDVTALMDSTGTILSSYYYDAFGNITETNGTADNPYRYAGYQYDSGTGLYYLNSRMYDPVTARFLQEDTYSGDKNDPLSLNLYTYCHNEPIMYVDPTGHAAEIMGGDSGSGGHYIPVGLSESYSIKSGDTLSKIAKLYNTTVDAIAKANDISNPNILYLKLASGLQQDVFANYMTESKDNMI